jgi:cyclopropane fatty-acyl-phospholipid synthase-like methyltransferase
MSSHLPNNQSWDRFWSQGKKKSGGIAWSKRRIAGIVSGYVAKGSCVLDAGCGSGYFSRYFLEQGADVTALDYSDNALAMTRDLTQGRAQTLRADLVHDNLADLVSGRRYHAIFSDGLFEHFEQGDQDKILRNFSSVLADNGVILTFVPNRWSPWQLIRPFLMPGIEEKPFILKNLAAMHQRNGLGIVSKGGVNVLPLRLSPEFLGPYFGMLVYVIAKAV